MDQNLEGKLLVLLKECLNCTHSENLPDKQNESIKRIIQHIHSLPSRIETGRHFCSFLNELIVGSNINFINTALQDVTTFQLLIQLFQCTTQKNAFLSYTGALVQSSNVKNARLDLITKLLVEFFLKDFKAMLVLECQSNSDAVALVIDEKIISIICNLPTQLANKTKGQIRHLFHPENYSTFLTFSILSVLDDVYVASHNLKNFNASFLSRFIGKLSLTGSLSIFLDYFVSFAIARMTADNKWTLFFTQLLTKIPERSLEIFYTELFKKLPWYGYTVNLLGDCIITNKKAKHILLNKLLLSKWFFNPLILQNIIGFLSLCDTIGKEILKTLQTLLHVWGDSSTLQHMSFEQQKYISQAIIIAVGFLSENSKKVNREEIITWLLPGMKCHLDSPDNSIRMLGMVIGEIITNAVSGDEEAQKLNFEFTKTEDSEKLSSLVIPPIGPNEKVVNEMKEKYRKLSDAVKCMKNESTDLYRPSSTLYTAEKVSKATYNSVGKTNATNPLIVEIDEITTHNPTEDFDSDDCSDEEDSDFVPYDMSHDVAITKVKKPMYVIDCMTTIRETEDREVMEVNLNAAEELIKRDARSAYEVAIEFSKIMLHLQDNFALDNYTSKRFGIMAALAVCNPIQVSEYLANEFYCENYNLQQRMDILHVLVAAAGELSSLEKKDCKSLEEQFKEVTLDDNESVTWRQIVDRRIESKTRRFGKKHLQASKNPATTGPTKFHSIAGHFFYPLMQQFDKQIRTFNMLGTDAIVLGRLLYSLGSILYSASNSPHATAMAKSLLEFCLEFRGHREAYVRQATLYCISMAMLSVPAYLQDQELMMLMRIWITNIIQNDNNYRTKELAAQTAMLIDTKAHESLNAVK